MKHTDTRNLYKEIEALDRRELLAAVKAHGGEYVFKDDEKGIDHYTPCVMAGDRHWDHNEDCNITRVVADGDWLEIYGVPCDGLDDGEIYLDDIEYGHLSYITDYIPETEEVKDVTEKPAPIKLYITDDPFAVDYLADRDLEGWEEYVKDDPFYEMREIELASEGELRGFQTALEMMNPDERSPQSFYILRADDKEDAKFIKIYLEAYA